MTAMTTVEPTWKNKIKIDLRVGSCPSPTDSAGPVTVNLANGNVNLGFSSPTVNTVGGPMGLSFSYNSLTPSDKYHGLTGSYYNALTPGQTATTSFEIPGKQPLLVRTDPAVSFDWGSGSPAPAVPSDYFMARWTGFITVPTNGTYTFGTSHDDGTKVTINNTTVVNQWTTGTSALGWVSPLAMTATPVPFQYDYYESTGNANVQLWVTDHRAPSSSFRRTGSPPR